MLAHFCTAKEEQGNTHKQIVGVCTRCRHGSVTAQGACACTCARFGLGRREERESQAELVPGANRENGRGSTVRWEKRSLLVFVCICDVILFAWIGRLQMGLDDISINVLHSLSTTSQSTTVKV